MSATWGQLPSARVLGGTEVLVGGAELDLGGRLARRLVAVLVLAEQRPVPDELIWQALWGDSPPARAAASIQAYVSRLRAGLGDNLRQAVMRTRGGYQLHVAEVDATIFAGQVIRSERALLAGEAAEAEQASSCALQLWRGVPYLELDCWPEAEIARSRLDELHALAEEVHIGARLQQGETDELAPDAEAAVQAAPFREHRWQLLILTLYRSGRQGDALAALSRARWLLNSELGVDPGPELRELEQRVLRHDPELLR
ncbi:DNA-binding transcriptional activator of the SARP family [Frankineae bacterium MT45]|nr:DNA-binding transcriptional activator of the SARP family [Frankineae bacterium MT45]